MPSPDTHEWYSRDYSELFDGKNLIFDNWTGWNRECVADFKQSHPTAALLRMTVIIPCSTDVRLVWVSIEGWRDPRALQGPEPTESDIPRGFV